MWKSPLYVAGAVTFLYIEPLLKNLFRGAGVFVSNSRAWQELMLPHTWANVNWVAMLMTVFVTLQELTRVIGKEQLKYMFFGHRSRLANQERFRDAA
jgi:hypothetical protein